MKLITLITAGFIASNLIIYPTVVLSQKAPSYAPGYWQPEAQIEDPKQPITVRLLNLTSIAISYTLTPEAERVLPSGRTTNIRVDLSSQPGNYATLNIYSESILNYDYNAEGNVVTVRVKPGSESTNYKAVYISPSGRVYSF